MVPWTHMICKTVLVIILQIFLWAVAFGFKGAKVTGSFMFSIK